MLLSKYHCAFNKFRVGVIHDVSWPTQLPTTNPFAHGPLTRYAKLRVAHAPGMPGTFSPPSLVSDPDMHHGTCVTHVP